MRRANWYLLISYVAFIAMPCLLMVLGGVLYISGYGIGYYLFIGAPLLCLVGIIVVPMIERIRA